MVRFVEKTVRSVLEQDYPSIEYIVVDGGSTDGSLEIFRSYEGRLRLVSEPDSGPPNAINKGMRAISGEIVTFLNADDYLLPGAVSAAVRGFAEIPAAAAVYGGGIWVDEDGAEIAPYPVKDFNPDRFREECFVCQPASFLRREAVIEIGYLDETLPHTFDYDLWIRLARKHTMARIPETLAASRMHTDSISLGLRRKVFEETIALLKQHYGYVPFRWIHSYVSFLADRRDQFFEPLEPGFGKYLRSLPLGLRHNARHPLRYVNEWRKIMTLAGLKRRLSAAFGR